MEGLDRCPRCGRLQWYDGRHVGGARDCEGALDYAPWPSDPVAPRTPRKPREEPDRE